MEEEQAEEEEQLFNLRMTTVTTTTKTEKQIPMVTDADDTKAERVIGAGVETGQYILTLTYKG